ncbi:hypothetical protein RZS28_03775 [Methylocapsa polymorpha]|uniref:Uncharacterized protein n=1 Tax=Methylocapsa polymorpha TaxID=3080828 RepID=A0ABZ0HVI5_9HYPH|nr:hypothetical protein RZS28_03775 [Methylocapsa sp. RX1]
MLRPIDEDRLFQDRFRSVNADDAIDNIDSTFAEANLAARDILANERAKAGDFLGVDP